MRRFIFLAIAVYFLASGSGIFTKTPPRWLDVGIGIVFLVMSNAARTRRSSMRELNETGQSAVVEPNEEQLWEINTLISEGKELEAKECRGCLQSYERTKKRWISKALDPVSHPIAV